jgi:hypothetical protein
MLLVRVHARLLQFATQLADGRTRPQPARNRRRNAIATLAVAVAAYATLHIALAASAELSRLVRDPVYADRELKLRRLEKSLPPGSDRVIFIGTSRTNNGFEAGRAQQVLSQELGRPAAVFNWGLAASGPGTHALHLRRLLADGHRPALLMLEVHPATLADLPDGALESRFTNGEALEWNEFTSVGSYGFSREKLQESRREVVVAPWYALRFQLLGRIMPSAIPYYLRYDSGRCQDPNGWTPLLIPPIDEERRAAYVKRAESDYRPILTGMRFGAGPLRALHELLERCHAEQIPVLLVWMPEGPSFRSLYPAAVTHQVHDLLCELAVTYRCRVCEAREWLLEDEFMDGHHILPERAGAFSERLDREAIGPLLRDSSSKR